MRAAVTGGTGFIGRKLVLRLLRRGDSIRLLTRQPADALHLPEAVKIHRGDLVDRKLDLREFLDGVEVLYHCAAEIRDHAKMYDLHVQGTKRLVDAVPKGMRWVQLSSVGVYGRVDQGEVTESSAVHPAGQYETTKAASDEIIVEAARNRGFGYSILRPSNVFGAEMKNRSLFQMIAMIDKGYFFFMGRPGASANYIHVDNVVEGLIRCGTLPQANGRIYNLSDYCTMEHFVEVIGEALGRVRTASRFRIPGPVAFLLASVCGNIPRFPLTRSRVIAMTGRSVYPIARIQGELGYSHVVSMDDGLKELVETYKSGLRTV